MLNINLDSQNQFICKLFYRPGSTVSSMSTDVWGRGLMEEGDGSGLAVLLHEQRDVKETLVSIDH